MRKRTPSLIFTAGAITLTVGLGTAPSVAATATTWTVKPGGSVTAKSTASTTLTDTSTGTVLTCKSSSGTATLKSGSGLAGAKLAKITSITFSTCTGPLGITFTVKTSAFPWYLNAKSYKSSTGVTTGTITGIHATLSGPSCSATVDGTTAGANNGMVTGTYTNKSHQLGAIPTGGNLHLYNVSGCFNLIHSGDTTTYSGKYAVSPAQTVSSP